VGLLELRLVLGDRHLEGSDLLDDARILLGGRVDRLDAVEEVLEAGRAEQDRECRVVLGRGVRTDQPGRERVLRDLQVRSGQLQLLAVLALVGLDLLQLDVGEVVLLDRPAEALVDLLNLREHTLCLRLLRGDRARRRIRRC
jgi:hypothetical protein